MSRVLQVKNKKTLRTARRLVPTFGRDVVSRVGRDLRARRMSGGREGFTLIEVMLAILILGIGLVVLVNSTSRCLAVVKSARLYEDARHLLSRVELEFPIEREDISEGKESGRFEGRFGNYTWERDIKLSGEDEDGFFEITTRIIWSETGNRVGREEVSTYLYVPESAEKGSF